jgi:hypothetical protein
MGRSRAIRFGLCVGLGLVMAMTAVAGCDGAKSSGGTPTGPVATTPADGEGGLGTGGLGTGGPGAGGSTGTGSPAPVGYPNDARAYGLAAISAWVNGQKDRLDNLSGPGVATNFLNIPGSPDSHWQYSGCEGAAGSQYCTYRNNSGDQLQLRLTTQLLGEAHAVSEVVFEKTEYPSSAEGYVSGFILAWTNGNRQRMLALANQSTVDLVTKGKVPANWTAQNNAPPPAGGYIYIFETSNDGFSMTFKVRQSALGKPHAIQCAKAGNATC